MPLSDCSSRSHSWSDGSLWLMSRQKERHLHFVSCCFPGRLSSGPCCSENTWRLTKKTNMIRPLRKYHRILWLILAFILPAGFVVAFILSRRFEKFYEKKSSHININITPNTTKSWYERFLQTHLMEPSETDIRFHVNRIYHHISRPLHYAYFVG